MAGNVYEESVSKVRQHLEKWGEFDPLYRGPRLQRFFESQKESEEWNQSLDYQKKLVFALVLLVERLRHEVDTKWICGTTLAKSIESGSTSNSAKKLEKRQTRFDRFWGSDR